MEQTKDDVSAFWDRNATAYLSHERPARQDHHTIAAAILERELSGRVLCIGGPWRHFDASRFEGGAKFFVVDTSQQMLAHWQARGCTGYRMDCRSLDLPQDSFDHVVLPLMLHHVTGNSGRQARINVRKTLAEAKRVVKPGGRIWIVEHTVGDPVYYAELLLSPLSRRVLRMFEIPLVVFHSRSFFRRVLQQHGCRDVQIANCDTGDVRRTELVSFIVGLPWLKVPRGLYPVSNDLIIAISE